jgi:hypothetical protein
VTAAPDTTRSAVDDLAERAHDLGWTTQRSTVYRHGMTLLILDRRDRSIHAWFTDGYFDRAYQHDGFDHGPVTTNHDTAYSWIEEAP